MINNTEYIYFYFIIKKIISITLKIIMALSTICVISAWQLPKVLIRKKCDPRLLRR